MKAVLFRDDIVTFHAGEVMVLENRGDELAVVLMRSLHAKARMHLDDDDE